MARYEVITFDCYGTLIDWESGIRAAFESAGVDGDAALRKYAEIEPQVERDYRPYRDVLREAGSRIAPGVRLAESLPGWKPFSDTNPALERLRLAGIRLGILSNVDDDLLAETRKHFTVDFDVIVTAQQVRSYKPAHGHFLEARKRIGNAKWLHAAQSNLHDIVPANQLRIPNAWINRHRERPLPGGNPTYEFANLTELADAMA
jgi:2-haloalkanoic acid dehalogenase type II